MAAYGITATFETSQTLPLPSAYNHCHLFIDLPARLPTYHFMTKYVYFLHLREHRPLITVLLGILVVLSLLGTPSPSKIDEFSEKFQTAFDPPPLIFGKLYCNFF